MKQIYEKFIAKIFHLFIEATKKMKNEECTMKEIILIFIIKKNIFNKN